MTYGYCPFCGAPVVSRERQPNGNDKCEQGHTYESRLTVVDKPEKDTTDYRALIHTVLLDGSDDDLWPPGLTMVEVVERLRDFYLAKRHDEQRRERRERLLRDKGFEEPTEAQLAENRLVNFGWATIGEYTRKKS